MLPLLVMLLSDPVAPAAPPVTPPTPPAERRICWRDQVTGSMMPSQRICMTVSERRAWVARMQGNVNATLDRRQRAPGMDDL